MRATWCLWLTTVTAAWASWACLDPELVPDDTLVFDAGDAFIQDSISDSEPDGRVDAENRGDAPPGEDGSDAAPDRDIAPVDSDDPPADDADSDDPGEGIDLDVARDRTVDDEDGDGGDLDPDGDTDDEPDGGEPPRCQGRVVEVYSAELEAWTQLTVCTREEWCVDGACVALPEGLGDGCGPSECPSDGLSCHGGVCLTRPPGAVEAPCVADLECTRPLICSRWGFCQAGAVDDPCFDQRDCVEVPLCGPVGLCQAGNQGDPCDAADDCDDLFYCANSLCQAGATGDFCNRSADCASVTDLCDGLPTACRGRIDGEACDGPAQCPAPLFCANRECQDGSTGDFCNTTDECEQSDDVCVGLPAVCVDRVEGDGCEGGEQCPATLYCASEVCQDGSTGDYCEQTSDCDEADDICTGEPSACYDRVEGELCVVPEECPPGLLCANEQCQDGSTGDFCNETADCIAIEDACTGDPARCTGRTEGELCDSSDHCPDDLYCSNSRCQDGSSGDFCNRTTDCGAADDICRGTPGTCIDRVEDDPCTAPEQCPSELVCANGRCQDGTTGDFCNATEDCTDIDDICGGSPATCRNRAEGSPCDGSDECPGALFCANEQCQDGTTGDFCNLVTDCQDAEDTCSGEPSKCVERAKGDECGGDAQCPGALFCANLVCQDGATGDFCGSTPHCDEVDDICAGDPATCRDRVDGDSCTSQTQCPGLLYCAGSRCQDGTTGDFCNATSNCDELDDICRGEPAVCRDRAEDEPCTQLGQCPGALFCANDRCQAGDTGDFCNDTSDCLDVDDVCDGSPGTCRARLEGDLCDESGQCTGDLYCSNGKCQDGSAGDFCNSVADCDIFHQTCGGVPARCRDRVEDDGCVSAGQCPGELFCANLVCQDGSTADFCRTTTDCAELDDICLGDPAACRNRANGDVCELLEECPGALYCANAVCQDGATGEFCNATSDCTSLDAICGGSPGTCRARVEDDPCVQDNQCPDGLYCANGRCQDGSTGDFCDATDDCDSVEATCLGSPGLCVDRQKGDDCDDDDQCPGALYCANAACQDGTTADFCDGTADCAEVDDICLGAPGVCRDRVEGDPCGAADQCPDAVPICASTGVCQDGGQNDLCGEHADCQGSRFCGLGGACVADRALASSCTDPEECASDNCANQVCSPAGFAHVPAGTFCMGSPDGLTECGGETPVSEAGAEGDEQLHEVTLTRAVYVQATEVTNLEWQGLMGTFPSTWGDPQLPVHEINWWEALAYANARSAAAGLPECYTLANCTTDAPGFGMTCVSATVAATDGDPHRCAGYRLPTEAEWEYSYRAETSTAFYNGGISVLDSCSRDDNLWDIGWYCGNTSGRVVAVGQLDPNAWGIHDMAGNVSEWVWDRPGAYPSEGVLDPVGFPSGTSRVTRGGGINSEPPACRGADRSEALAEGTTTFRGFRLVRTVNPSPCDDDLDCPGDVYCANGRCQVGDTGDFCNMTDNCLAVVDLCDGSPAICRQRGESDECAADEQCGDALYCANSSCEDGTTGDFCSTTEQCVDVDDVCDGGPAVCRDRTKGDACLGNAECAGALYCSNTSCQDGATGDFCNETADCGEDDDICLGEPAVCGDRVEGDPCASPSQCPAGLFCANGACQDGSTGDFCNDTGDCAEIDDICDGEPRACGDRAQDDPCSIDEQCPGELFCANGACQEGSTGDYCNTTAECDETDDVCAGEPATCADRIEGDACLAPAECPSALFCANEVCQDGSSGDFCNSTVDCTSPEDLCEGDPAVCVPRLEGALCGGDDECAGGLFCANAVCQDGSTGDFCNLGSDCQEADDECAGDPATCGDRVEGSGCSQQAHCPDALFCANEACQDGSTGDFCNTTSECGETDDICRGDPAVCTDRIEGDACVSEAQCAGALFCANDACYDGSTGDFCNTVGDCVAVDDVCDGSPAACRPRVKGDACAEDVQCGEALYCGNGRCQDGAGGDFCRASSDCDDVDDICKGSPAVCVDRVEDDPCQTTQECPGALVCANLLCQDGSTGDFCNETGDCEEGDDICKGGPAVCLDRVEDDPCSAPTDCPGALFCANDVCQDGTTSDYCNGTGDCQDLDDVCDGEPSVCRERLEGDACTNDDQCKGALFCANDVCQDGSTGDFCLTTADCLAPDDVCDGEPASCRPRIEGDTCSGDTQCSGDLYCANGRCQDGSTGDFCKTTAECDENDDLCRGTPAVCQDRLEDDPCSAPTDCPGALYCANEVCQDGSTTDFCRDTDDCAEVDDVCDGEPGVCRERIEGDACSADPQCAGALYCANSLCQAGDTGDFCDTTADCAEAEDLCDGGAGTCRERVEDDDCTEDTDCPGALFCANAVCQDGSTGDYCDAVGDCQEANDTCKGSPAVCVDRVEDDACALEGDCPGALFCANEVCQDGSTGDFCTATGDCVQADDICLGDPAVCADRVEDDPCSAQGDCPGALFCANEVCQDGSTGDFCNDTNDCTGVDDICNGVPGVCTDRAEGDPCEGDGECTGVLYCANSVCQDGSQGDFCDQTEDCQDGDNLCDGAPSTCRERVEGDACTGDTQCTGALHCASSVCQDGSTGDFCNATANCDETDDICTGVPKRCADRVEGDGCTTDPQCPGDLFCANALCQDGSTGDYCDATADCDELDDICKGAPKSCTNRVEGDGCTTDDECTGALFCANAVCQNGSTGDYCDTTGDCLDVDDVCDGEPAVCRQRVEGDGCSSDDQCAGALYCANSVCQDGSTGDYCDATGDCGEANDICLGAPATCRDRVEDDPCGGPSDCPSGLFCANAVCQDGTNGDYCNATSECDEIDDICTGSPAACTDRVEGDACAGDDECTGSLYCANAVCQDGTTGDYCDATPDCGDVDDVCAGSPAVCRERVEGDGCTTDDQCTGALYCDDDQDVCQDGTTGDYCDVITDCVDVDDLCDGSPAACRERVEGDGCSVDAECTGSLYCSNSTCQDGSSGDYCDETADCDVASDICLGAPATCGGRTKGDPCLTSLDCPGDLYCANTQCQDGTTGDYCNLTSDCDVVEDTCKGEPPACTIRVEDDTCTEDTQCPSGLYCANGACQDGSTGDFCDTTADCGEVNDICDGTCRDRVEGEACGGPTECPAAVAICSAGGVCQDGSAGDTCASVADCTTAGCELGACVTQCSAGRHGSECAECPGGAATPCSDNGTCDAGVAGNGSCDCDSGYGGDACETCLDFITDETITTAADGAWSVFAADIDGDGDTDALSASRFDSTIAWYENTAGDGSAWTAHTITTSANDARSVFAADVDGDGDFDALSASDLDDTIAWYENTAGDGSAWTARTITTAADGARSVFAADVDGDGDFDALSASDLDDTIAWYENTAGDGSAWTAHTITTAADGTNSVFAADVDGDGDTDALSASRHFDTIAWHENTAGDGSAWTAHTITTAADDPWSVFAADVDGDGDTDALSASEDDSTIAWYENTAGDGSAWTANTITTAANSTRSVYAADVDGDGDTDALSASGADETIVWYENTAGDGSAWAAHTITTVANGARSVFAADVDGDGDTDALSASQFDDTIAWYENRMIDCMCSSGRLEPSFGAVQTISTAADGAWSVFASDIDGDGDADALSASEQDDTIAWYENTAGDGSAWSIDTLTTSADIAKSVFAADVDGDGDRDVLSASLFDDTIAWYENTAGDGSAWTSRNITTTADFATAVFAADVDGDGDIDALSASSLDDTIAWYENTAGDGSTWTATDITTLADGANAVFAADVDGDGDIDALSASPNDDTIAWYSNTAGDGSAWSATDISTTADGALAVFAADVDGDGDTDALSASSADSTVAWFENTQGDGSAWTRHDITTAETLAAAVYAVDVDRDGDVDVLSASTQHNRVTWHENTAGDGSAWTPHDISSTAANIRSVFAVDIDRDGDTDVLTATQSDDRIAWYENTLQCAP